MGNQDKDLQHANEALLDEAESLIWALLDEEIVEKDLQRLQGLMQENEAVRRRYVECVQVDVDLREHFAPEVESSSTGKPKSPVLGFLGDLRPESDFLPPVPPQAE